MDCSGAFPIEKSQYVFLVMLLHWLGCSWIGYTFAIGDHPVHFGCGLKYSTISLSIHQYVHVAQSI